MRKLRPIVLRLLPVLLMAIVAIRAVHAKRAALAAAPKDGLGPLPVQAAVARAGTLDLGSDYVAVVEPQHAIDLAARLTAQVLAVSVREGDTVAAGDLLVTLRADDLQAACDAAAALSAAAEGEVAAQRATLAAVEKTRAFLSLEWERFDRLRASGAATDQQADAARERLDDAQGRHAAAQARLGSLEKAWDAARARQRDAVVRVEQDARLVAPFTGVVTARRVDPGDLAVPGRPLLGLASVARRLAFDVPQADLAAVAAGQPVTWREPAPGGSATLTRLHPALDIRRMRRAEADVPATEEALPALGAYVPVHVRTGRLDDVTLVPATALAVSPGEGSFVYAVEDGRLRAVAVERLGRSGDELAICGIAPGAKVVVNTFLGWTGAGEGRAVEIVP